jgi:hypothetical protein
MFTKLTAILALILTGLVIDIVHSIDKEDIRSEERKLRDTIRYKR